MVYLIKNLLFVKSKPNKCFAKPAELYIIDPVFQGSITLIQNNLTAGRSLRKLRRTPCSAAQISEGKEQECMVFSLFLFLLSSKT